MIAGPAGDRGLRNSALSGRTELSHGPSEITFAARNWVGEVVLTQGILLGSVFWREGVCLLCLGGWFGVKRLSGVRAILNSLKVFSAVLLGFSTEISTYFAGR